MKHVFEQMPAAPLRPFIQRFLLIDFPSHYGDVHLPDIGAVAAFSLRGVCRIDGDRWAPPAAFTGLYDTVRAHEHHDHAVLLATFTPAGAAAFLRLPLEEVAGTTTDLADLIARPIELDQLRERIAEAGNDHRRVQLLQEFLLARIRTSEPDPLVAAAVAWLEQGRGVVRIDDLTRYIGLSQSALERRFRRVVGVSPRKFASVVRLRHAVQLRATGMDLTSIALAAGYFDQSHFVRDFRRMSGSAPSTFFRQQASG